MHFVCLTGRYWPTWNQRCTRPTGKYGKAGKTVFSLFFLIFLQPFFISFTKLLVLLLLNNITKPMVAKTYIQRLRNNKFLKNYLKDIFVLKEPSIPFSRVKKPSITKIANCNFYEKSHLQNQDINAFNIDL